MSDESKTVEVQLEEQPLEVTQTEPCLLMLSGPDKGALYPLVEGDTTLGRASDCDLIMMGDNVSRKHLLLSYVNGKLSATDLGSTNGSFVNGERIQERVLFPGDTLSIGGKVQLRLTFQDPAVREVMGRLYQDATIDELTGVMNRKSFLGHLEHCGDGSLALIDIDEFKQINDRHGHQTGDGVLAQVGLILRRSLPEKAFLGRYGGEEFIAYLPLARRAAGVSLEGIRLGVASRGFKLVGGELLRITVSVGVTDFVAGTDPQNALQRADRALYQAKSDGRNRVALGGSKPG